MTVLALGCAGLGGPSFPMRVMSQDLQIPEVDGAVRVPLRSFLAPDVDGEFYELSDDVVDRCRAGESVLGEIPLSLAMVDAAPGGKIRVAGRPVGTLEVDGSIPDADRKGMLHVDLYDSLLNLAEASKETAVMACAPWAGPGEPQAFSGRLLVVLDERLPISTVRQLLYTAGQAQYSELAVVVEDLDAPTRPGLPPTATAVPREAPIIRVQSDGYAIGAAGLPWSASLEVPCAGVPCTEHPHGELREHLTALKPAASSSAAVVVPADGAPWGLVTETLATLRHDAQGAPLFPELILAGADGDGEGGFTVPPARTAFPVAYDGTGEATVIPLTLPALAIDGTFTGALARAIAERTGDPAALQALEEARDEAPEPARGTTLVKALGVLAGLEEASEEAAAGLGTGLGLGEPVFLGTIDREAVGEVVRRHASQIRYCYQRELAKDPSLSGRVVVKFVIAGDGSVSTASVKSSSLDSSPVEQCLTGRVRRMRFPAPQGGGIVIVSYPFVFETP